MPDNDPWKTTTGLYTDFSGTVEDSSFGTDSRYQNGEVTLLFWRVKPDIEVTTDDELIELAFPCGAGWFSYDGGDTIEHTSKANINKQSIYGKIIDFALENGLADTLRERGTPLMASVWKGLAFRFEEVEFDYKGEIGKKSRTMPVEVLLDGVEGTDSSGDDTDNLEGFYDELKALADNSPDAEAFTESALALTGITDHSKLVTRIADGSLFAELS